MTGFRGSIRDFSRAIEQGCAAVYRRNFASHTYEYIGRYIKEITGYDQTELTPELWDSLILHTEQKGELEHLDLAEANRLVTTEGIPFREAYRRVAERHHD